MTDEEKTQAAYWNLYETRGCTIGSPMHDFMLSHLDVLRANNGKEKVDRYLTAKYEDALGLYIMGYARKEDVPFGTLQRNVPLLKVAQQNELDKMLELAELVYHKKADELTELIEKRLPEMSVQELKMYAFGFRGMIWGSEKKEASPHITELGTKLTESVIANMEKRAGKLTADDLFTYTILIDSFYGKMTHLLYKRLADAGEKAMSTLPDNEEKERMIRYYKAYREKGNK